MTATSALLRSARRELIDRMPLHFERLASSRERLEALRAERLRALLGVAVERSPFHAERLAGIDPSRFQLGDLASLPVMTKTELMRDHDTIVTDRRLTSARIERHLEELRDEPAFLDGEYVVLASGGSSGIRATFAYDRLAAVEFVSAVLRSGLQQLASVAGWPPQRALPLAIVAAPACVHATRMMPTLIEGKIATVTYAPVTLPFAEMAARVQAAQPVVLVGYASAIARLADANGSTQLAVEPQIVICTSEHLTAGMVERITNGFGRSPVNSFGSSEGLVGSAPPGCDVFDFASDLAVIEVVDADDRPVPSGQTGHHVLVTNLFNHAQPLIRYRLDDVMTTAPPATDHGHQRASLIGRTDDYLDLAGSSAHPLVIRSLLVKQRNIVDYQVRHESNLVSIDVESNGEVSPRALATELTGALADVGAQGVSVDVRVVDSLERDPRTGKVKRFASHNRSVLE